jgi:Stage II sporulation protein E (SpoIIE)
MNWAAVVSVAAYSCDMLARRIAVLAAALARLAPAWCCVGLLALGIAAAAQAPIAAPSEIRYHMGDDTRWSDEGLDDSAWPVSSDGRIPAPELNSDGFFWVRMRVAVPADANGRLALKWLPRRTGPDAMEIFLNGVRVAGYGSSPPNVSPLLTPYEKVFDLPEGVAKAGEPAELVMRGWTMPINRGAPNAIAAGFSINRADLLHAVADQSGAEFLIRRSPELAVDLLLEFVGLGVLLLGVWSRRREILLGALWLVAVTVFLSMGSFGWLAAGADMRMYETVFMLVNAAGMAVVVEFVWAVQGFRDRIFLWAARICWIVVNVTGVIATVSTHAGPVTAAAIFIGFWSLFAFNVMIFGAQLWVLFRSGRNRAIAAAMALIDIGYFFRVFGTPHWLAWLPISFFQAAFYLSSFVIAGLLVYQTWAEWQKGDELRIEFAAGRELQQQLVPIALPAIAGLRLEAAFMPAKEVGGDFYQVIESEDSSTLVLVGDVSGKGLKAAMKGAQAIGALRALAAQDSSPGRLMELLNREMMRSQDGSFITCICVRVSAEGVATFANAGHLAPYRNGVEVALENGLPLGVFAGADYSETAVALSPGDTLTLMTDGVVEARNSAGELYGFDRTAGVSTKSADAIAKAAQEFGQDDDITVVTVHRVAN